MWLRMGSPVTVIYHSCHREAVWQQESWCLLSSLTFLPVLQPRGILAKSVFIFCTMLLTQYCPLCHRIWLSQWHWGRTRMSLDRLQETDSAAAICVQTVAILSYIFKYPQKILEPTFFLIISCKKVTSIYWFPLLMFEMNVWFLERDGFWSRRCLDSTALLSRRGRW